MSALTHISHKTLLLYILAVGLFTGCCTQAIRSTVESPNSNTFDLSKDNIWELRVIRWQQDKFTGLLAVKESNDILKIVLLDPNGIKLFTENITNNGKITRIEALNLFKKNRVPEYLGQAIYRIFKEAPDQASCSGTLSSLCWQEDEELLSKRARIGPFPWWDSSYSSNKKSTNSNFEIIYHSPWTGTTLQLNLL